MRLVHIKSNKPIVEFEHDTVCFHNKYLEKQMRLLGIPIPHGQRSLFEGVDCVFLGDKNFAKAFREIYYPHSIDPSDFQWRE